MKRTLTLSLVLIALTLGAAAVAAAETAAFAADYSAERYGQITPVGFVARLDSWLENTGTEADTYDFVMTGDLPPSWGLSACAGTLCYPPWITEFSVTLQPGESILIAIDVTPATEAEGGPINMTATSTGNPGLVLSRDFAALAPGSDVLFVDADGGYPYEAYFTDALTASGRTHQTWNATALGFLTAADLAWFDTVVWNAEFAAPALTDADRAALSGLLAAGGDLLLSGQDIASDLADPTSPSYTAATQQWYEDTTGAVFIAADSQDITLSGVSGDPIGDGMFLNIAAGSGADNQDQADVLTPASAARAFLEYSPGQGAAVRYFVGGAKVVTLGFGFEGIDTAAHRTDLMTAILDWFDADTPTGVGDAPRAARLDGDPTSYPNPFNPSTMVSFAVVGDGSVPVTVDVFDLAGRRVKRLLDDVLPAGAHGARWNGRDDAGSRMPSGVYLARVRAGNDVRASKLLLAK